MPGTPRSTETATASILVLGIVLATASFMLVLGAVGAGYVAHAELQQAADMAAVTLSTGGGDAPIARATAIARTNGARRVRVLVRDGGTRMLVRVRAPARIPFGFVSRLQLSAEAWADVAIGAGDGGPNPPGVYSGVLAQVDGVRVCPAVAAAYRRMDAHAARAGITLTPTSGFRSWAEQAVLFAQLGPRLAAPPGVSRHHDATELDINVGPAGSATHRWLQSNGPGHGFVQRYSWEPWHWGHVAGC